MDKTVVREAIDVTEFCVKAHQIWSEQWFALTCGDFKAHSFNSMTVAWGSFGTMWAKPFAQVVVRPSRYTFEFMTKHDSFTLCAFPKRYREALQLLGSRSGRDSDKIAESGLTPIAAGSVASPAFEEAELVVECATMYWDDFEPAQFLDESIAACYKNGDYHRVFFGQIVAVQGTPAFRCG